MSNLSLFSIKQEYKDLLLEAEEQLFNEGKISETTEKALAINKKELGEKIQNYKGILSMLDARVSMAEQEISRIESFKKRQESLQRSLKYNLLQALLTYGEEDKRGVKSLEMGTTRISTRKSSQVNIIDEKKLPDEYVSVSLEMPKTEWNKLIKQFPRLKNFLKGEKPRKAEIKKAKDKVPGSEIVEVVNLNIS